MSKEQPWYCLESQCIYCGKDDFSEEYGPRTFLECTACTSRGSHVGCHEKETGKQLEKEFVESGSDWFCCEVGINWHLLEPQLAFNHCPASQMPCRTRQHCEKAHWHHQYAAVWSKATNAHVGLLSSYHHKSMSVVCASILQHLLMSGCMSPGPSAIHLAVQVIDQKLTSAAHHAVVLASCGQPQMGL